MADISSQIFDECSTLILASFPTANLGSTGNLSPTKYPAVQIYEMDNVTNRRSVDFTKGEFAADVTYEVNIWSNSQSGKKSQAEAIFNIVNSYMLSKGFRRTQKRPIDENKTIYRLVVQYVATVTNDGNIYQR